jgi:nitrogen fixation protein NifX
MTLQRRLKIVADDDTAQNRATVKVAFASADATHVDQHFGAAEGFVIYRVDAQHSVLLEAAQFGRLDCVAVYCQAVGASAISQLKTRGIQPMKVAPGTPISGLLRALRQELRDGPSAWLARAIERRAPAPQRVDRFAAMEAEGWSE